ncbi:MAG: hypothetical protein R6W73_05325 [Candidatus Saliniplasma sp.]
MLDKDMVQKIKDLSLQGEEACDIAEKLNCEVNEVLKIIGLEDIISDVVPQKTQSKAFEMFDKGKKPVDLVKDEILTVDEAGLLYNKFVELSKIGTPEESEKESVEKLSTQLGLLGSRLSRVELKIMNSVLLPKTRVCNKCDTSASYGIGIVCSNCGDMDIIQKEKKPADIVKGIHELIKKKE